MSSPKVSVITPCYNCATFMSGAIESALAQCGGDVEVLCVDDHSSDNTPDLLTAMAATDSRVRPILLRDNGGPGRARNIGIENAAGEWIAALDADDLFMPDRLTRLLSSEAANKADLLVDGVLAVDEVTGSPVGNVFAGLSRVEIDLDFYLRNCNPDARFRVGWLRPVYRRALVTRSGIRYPEKVRYGEDMAFLAMLLSLGSACFVPEIGYSYSVSLGKKDLTVSKSRSDRQIDELIRAHTILRDWLLDREAHDSAAVVDRNIRIVDDFRAFREARDYYRSGHEIRAALTVLSNPVTIRTLARRLHQRYLSD